jgi:hypothetical protein
MKSSDKNSLWNALSLKKMELEVKKKKSRVSFITGIKKFYTIAE